MIWLCRKVYLISPLVFTLLLCSCSLFPGYTTLENHSRTGKGWNGILGTNGSKETVQGLFYVHGMGRTARDFSKTLRKSISENIEGEWDIDQHGTVVQLPQPIVLRGEALDCETNPDSCFIESFGKLYMHDFNVSSENTKVPRIRIFAYYWDDSAAEIQKRYRMYCSGGEVVADECDRNDTSPVINASLRQHIIVNGFGDAALYLGDFGKVFRQGLQAAMCQSVLQLSGSGFSSQPCTAQYLSNQGIKLDDLFTTTKLSFLAKSLGSRILFDTLFPGDELDALAELARCPRFQPIYAESNVFPERARCEVFDEKGLTRESLSEAFPLSFERIAAEIEFKNSLATAISEYYMFANQMPLLGLGRLTASSESDIEMRDHLYCQLVSKDSDCYASPLYTGSQNTGFKENSNERKNSVSPLSYFNELADSTIKIVAFRDPGDFLGFQAGEHLNRATLSRVEFYELRRRNTLSWLVFSNPVRAHANEDKASDAVRSILCGGKNDGNGKVEMIGCG